MDIFAVSPLRQKTIAVRVPSSKSVLNRALLLSAFTEGNTELVCGTYADDTKALIDCLQALSVPIRPTSLGLEIAGTSAPLHADGALHMGSAGTVARFLTAMLAYRGGTYELHASKQMESRPMDFSSLRAAGARFTFLETDGRLPVLMHSDGCHCCRVEVDTDTSTQFASGLMLAAAVGRRPFTVALTGSRTHGSYLKTTESVIKAFGADVVRQGDELLILPTEKRTPLYEVEPDVSGACYFYALALLCGARVKVYGVHETCLQSDIKFLSLLRERGVKIEEEADGIVADGSNVSSFAGFDLDMQDFSDQALTVAALAPFASTPSHIYGIGHIKKQECDRIEAIKCNLTRLGVPCEATEDSVSIVPAPVQDGTIETFNDHRVAMAFSLIGLKKGGIGIKNPACCSKTFPDYFRILSGLV